MSLRSLLPGLFISLNCALTSYLTLKHTHCVDPGLISFNSPKIPGIMFVFSKSFTKFQQLKCVLMQVLCLVQDD